MDKREDTSLVGIERMSDTIVASQDDPELADLLNGRLAEPFWTAFEDEARKRGLILDDTDRKDAVTA